MLVPSRQSRKIEISGAGATVSLKLRLFVLLWALSALLHFSKQRHSENKGL